MKINLYLSTAVAGLMMFGGEAYGQCVSSQDCATLGYTESSCPNGGVKCPFGNAWFCVDQCGIGFKYTCTGTGYGTQPASAACNGKYTSCVCADKYTWSGTACTKCGSKYTEKCNGSNETGGADTGCGGYYAKCSCATGYEWKDGSCQKQVLNGAQGELYYCNGTVVGVRATGNVAMKDLGTMTWNNANSLCQNYSFCGNVRGTLPTKDQLLSIYQNKSRVNSLLSTNGGTQLTNIYYWSSTYSDSGTYYVVYMSKGNVYTSNRSDHLYVRPVLASY